YMSPEQGASTHAVDARTDIYSLGCTLWFLLTSRRIYPGETLATRLLRHREAPIPSLAGERPDVPPELERIYSRMVAKCPDDRYPSMSALLKALEDARSAISNVGAGQAPDQEAIGLSVLAQRAVHERRLLAPAAQGLTPGRDAPTTEFRDGV